MTKTANHGSLREQLAPVAAKLREHRTLIRPVSQVLLRLKAVEGKDRYALTIDQVLRWMDRRAGKRLPDAAWRRESFQMEDVGAQRTAAVALPDADFWAARLDDADKNVAQRTWVTEVGVGKTPEGDVLFGVRLICAFRGEDQLIDRSLPGIVRGVFDTGPVFLDTVEAHAEVPRFVHSEAEVEDLIRLLESPARRVPIVVFTLPDGSADPAQTMIPAREVLRATTGAAHVIVLSGPASYHLTTLAGKELSVFRQAVRIYHRGFNRWNDQAARHPLALPARIESWSLPETEDRGPAVYSRWLVQSILAASIQRPDREDELPSFNAVRQVAAQQERKKLIAEGGSQAELLKMFEDDNQRLAEELRDERENFEGQLAVVEDERDAAQQQVSELRGEAFDLRERIRVLHDRLNKAALVVPKAPTPKTLDRFDAWVREHLAGSVTLHNRAFRGVEKSKFKEPMLIYQALLLLRDHYVPMRRQGCAQLKDAYEQACMALQFEDSFVGDAATRTHRAHYTVNYGGKPRLLDRHLKRGKSHDEAISFRLYYFWDDETETVVVGWLPSHLDNSMT